MDNKTRNEMLAMMFGEAALTIDLLHCAKVFYKPSKTEKAIAWLPIGWDTHQPVLLVMAQDDVKTLVKADGEMDVELVIRSYVCIDALPEDLREKIREHLNASSSGSEEYDGVN